MKRFNLLSFISRVFPHITLICAGMFAVFLYIDSVNSSMGFLTSELSKVVLWIFVISAIITGAAFLENLNRSDERREKKNRERRRAHNDD